MGLTTKKINAAVIKDRDYKIHDENNLTLIVSRAGNKYWRVRYYWMGKEQSASLGKYPLVSLEQARVEAKRIRELLDQGINPALQKQQDVLANTLAQGATFGALVREFQDSRQSGMSYKSNTRTEQLIREMDGDLGKYPITSITAPQLLISLRRMESSCPENAWRAKTLFSQVARMAVQTGRATEDVTVHLRGAINKVTGGHRPALIRPRQVGLLMSRIDTLEDVVVRNYLITMAHIFQRPGEVAEMLWTQIDWLDCLWDFTVRKTGMAHSVPLSTQMVTLLKEQQRYVGASPYVFPSHQNPNKPLVDVHPNAALRTLGYDTQREMCSHGFRSTARTLLVEELEHQDTHVEIQLSHSPSTTDRSGLGGAYLRARYLKQRTVMMSDWSSYLGKLKDQNRGAL